MFNVISSGVPTAPTPSQAPELALDKANGVIYISTGQGAPWREDLFSAADALVAFAGGGQANGTKITTQMARFTTVATIADSATLPAAVPGMSYTVSNAAANSMNVFPATGEIINALAANAAFAVAGAKTCEFVCMKAGQWHTLLSA